MHDPQEHGYFNTWFYRNTIPIAGFVFGALLPLAIVGIYFASKNGGLFTQPPVPPSIYFSF
jgi:hypothetical protein